MAAPADATEQAFRLRKFQGTNTQVESTFLGPSLVSRSENWFPTQSYRLGKRPGSTLMQAIGNSVLMTTDLLATRGSDGSLYLYAYGQRASDAFIFVSKDEQAFTFNPPNVGFTDHTAIGRMVQFRDRVFCGNGVDPLVSWLIGTGTGTVHGVLTVTGAPPAPGYQNAGANSPAMPSGSYEYCWALYNPTTGLYVSRTSTDPASGYVPISVPAQSVLVMTVPGAPPAGQVYRLFIAPRGFPIEYATAQDGDWTAGESHTYSHIEVTPLRVPIAGVLRTGNMLLVWRNRVVFAGMRDDPFSVFATDVLLPGLEQATFNQGTFFPVSAKVKLPRKVTGIGLAGVTSEFDASAPLVAFTLSKTFLYSGDPFSTVTLADQIELSSRVGCIGHDSIVNTPYGLIFCGLDSVYLIPPGGGYPQDIGWPIADQIRAVPPSCREKVSAVFHKQFYKIALCQRGGTANTQQWWLDLRQGVDSPPSWWGPMIQRAGDVGAADNALCAMTTDIESTAEVDRGYAALDGTDKVIRTHQVQVYTDYVSGSNPNPVMVPVKSVLQTGRFDADQPFIAKVFTRLRLIAQTGIHTFIHVIFKTDQGVTWTTDDIELGKDIGMPGQFVHLTRVTPSPPTWKSWNHLPHPQVWPGPMGNAQFQVIAPVEVQTITMARRPRGLSCVLSLTHDPHLNVAAGDPRGGVGQVELRDFELLFIPSERKVRYLGESTGR